MKATQAGAPTVGAKTGRFEGFQLYEKLWEAQGMQILLTSTVS